jgi:hypothetical protein
MFLGLAGDRLANALANPQDQELKVKELLRR